MKKLLAVTLILAMLVTLCACGGKKNGSDETAAETAVAENTTDYKAAFETSQLLSSSQNDMFKYNIYENFVVIMKYIGTETDMTIPDEIDGKPVWVIGTEAFLLCGLKSVNIGGIINVIGTSCFRYCPLSSVNIGKSVKTIDEFAFSYSDKLKEITLPESLKSLGHNAFGNCPSLEKVTILSKKITYDYGYGYDSDPFYNTSDGLTIYGYAGSSTEQMCTDFSHIFVPITE